MGCDELADDRDWKDVQKLLQIIGPDKVMGVAIGNEVELLFQNGASSECIARLWKGRYILDKFNSRIKDLDALGSAWPSLPVTSIFSQYIWAGAPFIENPQTAMVLSFI